MTDPRLLRRVDSWGEIYAHPVIREMFNLLPPAGTLWPAEKQAAWLEAMECLFVLIYRGDV